MAEYDGKTKDELAEELRSRDLPVSGNKDELVSRLKADDQRQELHAEGATAPKRDADFPSYEDAGAPDGRVRAVDERLDAAAGDRGTYPNGEKKAPIVTAYDLSGDEAVAARTAPDAEADGNFRHTFVLSARGYDENADNDDMHRANQVATLQFALNKGVHPKGEAYLESTERTPDGSVRLTYAVEAVPAEEDEDTPGTQVPAKAIKDMGGSTAEHAQNSVEYGTATDNVDDAGITR